MSGGGAGPAPNDSGGGGLPGGARATEEAEEEVRDGACAAAAQVWPPSQQRKWRRRQPTAMVGISLFFLGTGAPFFLQASTPISSFWLHKFQFHPFVFQTEIEIGLLPKIPKANFK